VWMRPSPRKGIIKVPGSLSLRTRLRAVRLFASGVGPSLLAAGGRLTARSAVARLCARGAPLDRRSGGPGDPDPGRRPLSDLVLVALDFAGRRQEVVDRVPFFLPSYQLDHSVLARS
jgi:hypothetical protein